MFYLLLLKFWNLNFVIEPGLSCSRLLRKFFEWMFGRRTKQPSSGSVYAHWGGLMPKALAVTIHLWHCWHHREDWIQIWQEYRCQALIPMWAWLSYFLYPQINASHICIHLGRWNNLKYFRLFLPPFHFPLHSIYNIYWTFCRLMLFTPLLTLFFSMLIALFYFFLTFL